MKTFLRATGATVLALTLSLSVAACSGDPAKRPAATADRYDTMWVEVTEAMTNAHADTRPETPYGMNVAFGFNKSGPYEVVDFTSTDEGTTVRLCVEDTEQEIYLLSTKDGLTYLGEGGCAQADPATATVVINPGMRTVERGKDQVPSAVGEFARAQ